MTPIVTVDWETYYVPGSYSLKGMTTEAYIRDPRFETIGCSIWMPEEPAPIWYVGHDAVQAKLSSIDWRRYALLAHHTAFDGSIGAWRFGIRPKFYLDTLSMARPTFGLTVGGSLAALAKIFGLPDKGDMVVRAQGKRLQDFTPQELAEYGAYCCHDNWLCRQIYTKIPTELKELVAIDQVLRCFIEPTIMLDKPMLVDYYDEVVNLKAVNYQWAANLLQCEPEQIKTIIMSNDKLAKLLLELGVDPPTKISPATGKVAFAFAKTDEEFLALKEHPDEAVQILVECRLGGKSTQAETRAKRFIEAADRGPFPIPLGYYLAHTGRLGGWDDVNLQNMPRHRRDRNTGVVTRSKLRDSLCAPPQHLLVGVDLSQIEARIAAAIAGQMDVVEAFRAYDEGRGPDIYCVTASQFLQRQITKAANPNERQLGKVIRLALTYGMGWERFKATARIQEGLILTDAQCAAAVEWYRNNNTFITALWKRGDTAIRKLIAGQEYAFGVNDCIVVRADGIHCPSGRVLRYPNLQESGKDEYDRPRYTYTNRKKIKNLFGAKVIENVCQLLAGSVCQDGWLRLRGHMRVVLQAHDELVGLTLADHAPAAVARMRAAMSETPEWMPWLPVACEVGVGDRYGTIEKT